MLAHGGGGQGTGGLLEIRSRLQIVSFLAPRQDKMLLLMMKKENFATEKGFKVNFFACLCYFYLQIFCNINKE